MDKQDITLSDESLIKEILGKVPDYRIRQIYQWLWTKNINSFNDFTNLPKRLRDDLQAHFFLPTLTEISRQTAKDGTVKIAFQLVDQLVIEGVLIPESNRVTACISSQVGCNVGCRFCATGKMGFSRNLSVGEIVFQVKKLNALAEKIYGHHLSNIVFMGMGEPLLNYQNTMRAAHILTMADGLAMSPRRITVSTVGIADKIIRMADEQVKFNLAVSLHSAIEKTRQSLIPVNKNFPLPKLRQAIHYFSEKTGNRVTIEYLLMANINDSEHDASALAEFTKAFPCKINVIEYNPVEGLPFQRPEPNNFNQFVNFLKSKHLIVMVRRSRGKDIDAACGQLASKTKNKN